MATLIGIAGPSCTGKSILVSKLREGLINSNINKLRYYITEDIKDATWNTLVNDTSISQWDEVYNDKDILMMFVYRMVSDYERLITELKDSTFDFCIIDTTYIDLLIYAQLHFWYHYPSYDLLTEIVNRILSLRSKINTIYMTRADDNTYKFESKDLRQRMTDFRNNRALELTYYDIYRELPSVVTVSDDVNDSYEFIMNDIMKRFYNKGSD